jgi:hypothetical protein
VITGSRIVPASLLRRVCAVADDSFGAVMEIEKKELPALPQDWVRIVVHEFTHRDVKTQDHAYEHQGINSKRLTAVKAIENADSWAWFCADCTGALTDGVVTNALAR